MFDFLQVQKQNAERKAHFRRPARLQTKLKSDTHVVYTLPCSSFSYPL